MPPSVLNFFFPVPLFYIAPVLPYLSASTVKMLTVITTVSWIGLRTVAQYFLSRQLEGMRGKDLVSLFFHTRCTPFFPTPFPQNVSACIEFANICRTYVHLKEAAFLPPPFLLHLLLSLVDELEEARTLAATCAY